jgi:hypothetical protein
MKKNKPSSKFRENPKSTIEKKIPESKQTLKPDSTEKNIPGKEFGGIKIKKESSSDEARKNVNADPNMIQGNQLDEESND